MWRASGYVQIDGQERSTAVMYFGVSRIRPAADGTGPDGDDQFRRGNRGVSGQQRLAHVLADRACNDEAIRMPRRSDELDSKTAQGKDDRTKYVQVGLAGVAAGGADLAELQGATEEPAGFLIQGCRQPEGLPLKNEVLSCSRRETVFLSVANGSLGTRLHAIRAEKAPTQVQLKPLILN